MRPFLLYHWSPTSRRKSILRYGLKPKCKSKCGLWKPPYICFSKSPSLAWNCSAYFHNKNIKWDLWMVWSSSLEGYETLKLNKEWYGTEYRCYHRVKKSKIWHVGSREYKSRKK